MCRWLVGARGLAIAARNLRYHAAGNLSRESPLIIGARMTSAASLPDGFKYPNARRDESIVDDYAGVKIADPYRALEDPDCSETKAFVDKCNEVSTPFLQGCECRDKIKETLTKLWDYPKQSVFYRHGAHYFSYFNSGLQNQSVLYIQERLDSEKRIFLDPNTFSDDGTTSLSMTAYSHDGTLFAYGLSEKGSDWNNVQFKKIPSGEDLPDKLDKLKFSSLAWTHDNKGVFYNRYPDQKNLNAVGTCTTKNQFHTLYYHVLGTPQSEDIVCVDFPDHPEYMIGAEVTEDGRYLVCHVDKGCDPANLLYYYELSSQDGIKERLNLTTLIGEFEAKYNFVCNDGPIFTILTNSKASMFKLIQIDITKPEKENWKVLIEEDKHAKVDWATLVSRDKLVLCYEKDVKNVLQVHSIKSGELLYTLPLDIGTVAQFSGKEHLDEVFYKFQNFLTPGVIYRADLSEPKPKPQEYHRVEVGGIDSSKFVTEQVFYESKDGTKVPMFIVHLKDLKLDGSNPCLLYGYGGFNHSMTPSFSVSRTLFMKHFRGVFSVANIRGGSEYGEDWHQGGMRERKQNVFDDFIAAAEYLVKNQYTNSQRLAINGGSNGGLLVAACANQRPDLFGAVVNQVGVMDMLRFQNFTIGHAWVPEFGVATNPDDFKFLIKYSPLHNLKVPEGGYPAMLLQTADHDDRVVPLHSLKYIAELYYLIDQEPKKQKKPVLIRIDTKAGHGAGKPTSKVIEELTDTYSFLARVLAMEWID